MLAVGRGKRFERVRAAARGVYLRRGIDEQQRGTCGEQQRLDHA
jgi:hypothetical protein